MTKTTLSIVSALLLAASAAHADAKLDDLGERATKMFERIADDVDKTRPDCDRMGASLNKHADEDAALVKELAAADRGKSKDEKTAEKKEMQAKFGARMQAAQKKMAPLRACTKNAQVQAYNRKVGL